MICVLMSTYNGERYLREQIDSILGQKGVDVCLVVRDDGSTDGTVAILNEYAKLGKLVWKRGQQNLGPARSFMALLQEAPKADFYAFADQDDVWNPDKLALSVRKIEQHANGEAIVVHTDLMVTDDSLQVVHPSFWKLNHIMPEKINCLNEDVRALATGCTMVLNSKAREISISRVAKTITMHDAWVIAAVYSCGGQVLTLPIPTVRYRQHDKNVIGAPKTDNHSFGYYLTHVRKTVLDNYNHYQMLKIWGYPGLMTYLYQKVKRR